MQRRRVVGFDLDMTLVDSRPGVHAAICALNAESETAIDADVVVERLGPPLEEELAHWVPAEDIAVMADRYRELYAVHGVPGTFALPGAADALAAVRSAGCGTLVVTAKFELHARQCLSQAGLEAEHVVGWRHGPQKAESLLEHGAIAYIGDTPPDIEAARCAGAVAVGVASGPHGLDELRDAGADVVLESLREFPDWFTTLA
ncbi:MAG TPA: HAD family hydrolase [Acidimicrobiia bacterium]|jgi:phosphoglycolate phosphatase